MRTLALFVATLVVGALPAASQADFRLDDPVLSLDGRRLATVGAPLAQNAFGMLTMVVPGEGTYRISHRPFAGAQPAGQFEGAGLVFAVGGRSVRLRGRRDLLSDATPTPAYVAFEPAAGLRDRGPARLSVADDGSLVRTDQADARAPRTASGPRQPDATGRADLDAELRSLRRDLARLTEEHRRLTTEGQAVPGADRRAMAEREALRTERDRLLAERDRTLRDRDALSRQLAAMQRPADPRSWTDDGRGRAEVARLQAELAALAADRDALRAERDALRLEMDAVRAGRARRAATPGAPEPTRVVVTSPPPRQTDPSVTGPVPESEGAVAFLPGFDFDRLQNPDSVRRRLDAAEYPRWATVVRIEGDVLVLFQTDRTGRVIRTAVPSPIGGGLDALAEAIVQDMQFVAPVVGGQPTGLRSQVVVRFEL